MYPRRLIVALVPSLAFATGVAIAIPATAEEAAADPHAHHHQMMAEAAAAAKPEGPHYQRSVQGYELPDVTLVNSNGERVRLRQLLETRQPVMLNFIFTTCTTICPVMSKVFADVPAKLGPAAKNLRRISISIDPENDTPARLKAYGKTFHADRNWVFLTGRVEDIKAVQMAFNSYRGDKMSHEPLTLMRGARQKDWLRLNGFATPTELATEYRALPRG